jgi:beta-glucanase (GH16 family)
LKLLKFGVSFPNANIFKPDPHLWAKVKPDCVAAARHQETGKTMSDHQPKSRVIRSMLFGRLLMVAVLLMLILATDASTGQTWSLIWSDEFNGAAGSPVDTTKWVFDIGGGGWGNNELEYYTNSAPNASMDGNGNLVITAIKETLPRKKRCWYGRCQYSSARIKTAGTFMQAYGRFEARIKVPYGQGIWPAFWMLGKNINKVGWPRCGEIDIMENIGREPAKAHGTIHGPGYSGANGIGAAYNLSTGAFADDFHLFAIEWEPGGAIRWYVDGNLYQTRTQADLPAGAVWVFDRPFFILLNLAVGGSWPGNPDATTVFPQRMYVDYVRVYQ